MDSDEEYNSPGELLPRTSLQPTPSHFSHAPFKSVVPDVSLVFNKTQPQPITDALQSTSQPSSESFESYNVWRHNNLKTYDQTSPRFKYYATSPRYTNGTIPTKTGVEQRNDNPRAAPLIPINFQPSCDNIEKDSCNLIKNNSPENKRYISPASSHKLREDVNYVYPQHFQKYQNSKNLKTIREPFLSTNLPLPSSQDFKFLQQSCEHINQQSNQQCHYQFKCFERNVPYQNCHINQPAILPSNFSHSQLRNSNHVHPSNNLYHHGNCIQPEVLNNNSELNCYAIHESPLAHDSVGRNVHIAGQEGFYRNGSSHRGQEDCVTESVQMEKGPEDGISFADLYRLIQMQNKEICGLRAQVQGLLNQSSGKECQGSSGRAKGQRMDADSDWQMGKGRQGQEQFYTSAAHNGERNGSGNAEPQPLCLQGRANIPDGTLFRPVNAADAGRTRNQRGIDVDSPLRSICESQMWDENTNHSAPNGEWTQRSATSRQNQAFNGSGSTEDAHVHRPMGRQTRAVVQQVSIGVMTSFVDENICYQGQKVQKVSKQNALLCQVMAGRETQYANNRAIVHANDGATEFANNRTPVYANDRATEFANNRTPVYANDRATEFANDRATEFANDRTPVHANDRATEFANNRTPVHANDRATEFANNRTPVHANDRATEFANDRTPVHVNDRATQRANDRATQRANDKAAMEKQGQGGFAPAKKSDQHTPAGGLRSHDGHALPLGGDEFSPWPERPDLDDFRSDSSGASSSAEGDPSQVGWTFYHNMVGQVNDMLHPVLHGCEGCEREHQEGHESQDPSSSLGAPGGCTKRLPGQGGQGGQGGSRGEGYHTQQANTSSAATRVPENGRKNVLDQDNPRNLVVAMDKLEQGRHDQHRYEEQGHHDQHRYKEQGRHDQHRNEEQDRHDQHRYEEQDRHQQHPYEERDHHEPHRYDNRDHHEPHRYDNRDHHEPYRYGERHHHEQHRQKERDRHEKGDCYEEHQDCLQREVVDRRGMLHARRKVARVATVQQLQRLGVNVCHPEGTSILASSKKVTFDSVYYVPQGANGTGPSDISMRMDALALKYLQKDQGRFARPQGNHHGSQEPRIYDLASKVCNVSMATMKYLERYQLLPGNPQNQTHAPGAEQRAPFARQEPMRNDFRPVALEQRTMPPHKILDITALKEQPKFI